MLSVCSLRRVSSAYVARTMPKLLQVEPMPCNINWFVPLCRKWAGLGRLFGVQKQIERVRVVSFTGSLCTETIVVSRRPFIWRSSFHLLYRITTAYHNRVSVGLGTYTRSLSFCQRCVLVQRVVLTLDLSVIMLAHVHTPLRFYVYGVRLGDVNCYSKHPQQFAGY